MDEADVVTAPEPSVAHWSIQNLLWPMGNSYHLPSVDVSAGFLMEEMPRGTLVDPGLFVVRDGLFSLMWFFSLNPAPGKFKKHLLLSESLVECAPDAWKAQVGVFRIEKVAEKSTFALNSSPGAIREDEFGSIHELIVYGINSERYTNISRVRNALSNLQSMFGSFLVDGMKKSIFFPDGCCDWSSSHLRLEFAMNIGRTLGSSIRTLEWNDVHSRDSYSGALVLDLSSDTLCTDNYLTHLFLSRGAAIVSDKSVRAGGQLIRLSRFHGLRIWLQPEFEAENEPSLDLWWSQNSEMQQFSETLDSMLVHTETSQMFPWPRWFENWCLQAPYLRKQEAESCV